MMNTKKLFTTVFAAVLIAMLGSVVIGAWPTDTLTNTHLDDATDDPSQARVELNAAVLKLKDVLGEVTAGNTVADLESTQTFSGAKTFSSQTIVDVIGVTPLIIDRTGAGGLVIQTLRQSGVDIGTLGVTSAGEFFISEASAVGGIVIDQLATKDLTFTSGGDLDFGGFSILKVGASKTASQNFTSTSFVDDTHMANIGLIAGTYQYDLRINISSASGVGCKAKLNLVTGSYTSFNGGATMFAATAAETNNTGFISTGSGLNLVSGTNGYMHVVGTFRLTSSATLTVQFALNTGSGTLVVASGTSFSARRTGD